MVKSKMFPFTVIMIVSFLMLTALAAPAEAFLAANAVSFHNTGPAAATDFHVDFWLPTMCSAKDRFNGDWYAPGGGVGDGLGPWDQNLLGAHTIPPCQSLTIFYAPGNMWPLDNLKAFNFTPTNAVAKQVSLLTLLEKLESGIQITFTNYGSETISLTTVTAWVNVPAQYFTVTDFAFHTGTPTAAIPSSFDLGAGQSVNFNLGNVTNGYALVTGFASIPSDPGYLYDFAYAGMEESIPTVSEWGLIVMAGLLLTVGAVAIRRRFKTVPA